MYVCIYIYIYIQIHLMCCITTHRFDIFVLLRLTMLLSSGCTYTQHTHTIYIYMSTYIHTYIYIYTYIYTFNVYVLRVYVSICRVLKYSLPGADPILPLLLLIIISCFNYLYYFV